MPAATGSATIAAIATAVGPGGVGVIRLSGPDAIRIAAELIGKPPAALPDRVMTYGAAQGRDGRIDEVLVVAMRAPRSYTGEDVAEVHGHGGAKNLSRLVRAALDSGARLAEPGEFTRRAFENGKLDLTRAEAVLDVIEAGSDRALRLAQQQLAGELGGIVRALRARATDVLAGVEARVDFPEEGLEHGALEAVSDECSAIEGRARELAATFVAGRALREGIAVALVGEVNAGKSSLFNQLVGEERAIVTPEAGTTRDYVEARVEWDGLAVTLIDTAGWRTGGAAGSEAEQRGLALSERRAGEADLRLAVRALGMPALAPAVGRLRVLSKADEGGVGEPGEVVTSARTGRGVQELRRAVVDWALGRAGDADEGVVVTSERQRALLERAAKAFGAAADGFRAGMPEEMVAVDLREGLDALSEVLGERVGDEVLDALFARFCIGK